MTAARLHAYLVANVVPVVGVAVVDPADKATWTVQPESLQATAQPLIDAFVMPTPQQLADEAAQRETDLRILRAIVIELHAIIPAPKPTLVQLRQSIIDRYKALNGGT